ncbi:LPXTG cell wall anchor domain-containing protein [Auritidibacter ignavus]|uniref:LPXTG cell wall anchor domain-containing protein n=1 Tax=Auritidibacter ignavus TaxID=678932 RepID=UPI002449A6E7|nr:LPXTG cell wall anchor domain-containing protein [Auritidibacter ignavus]WGH89899.1 LPXTG cell wall anchor domain-containing protein [Auritidibacter ignavus]
MSTSSKKSVLATIVGFGSATALSCGLMISPAIADTTEPPAQTTDDPTDQPTDDPTDEPTDQPTDDPTDQPTDDPTDEPTDQPTDDPTDEPTDEPSPTDTELPDTCDVWIVDSAGSGPREDNTLAQGETLSGVDFAGVGLEPGSQYTWAVSTDSDVDNAEFSDQADEEGFFAFNLGQETRNEDEAPGEGTQTALAAGDYTVTVDGTQGNGEPAKDCTVNFTVVADKDGSGADNGSDSDDKGSGDKGSGDKGSGDKGSGDKGSGDKEVVAAGSGQQGGGDTLANTGATAGVLAGAGALAIAGGAAALIAARRRAHS